MGGDEVDGEIQPAESSVREEARRKYSTCRVRRDRRRKPIALCLDRKRYFDVAAAIQFQSSDAARTMPRFERQRNYNLPARERCIVAWHLLFPIRYSETLGSRDSKEISLLARSATREGQGTSLATLFKTVPNEELEGGQEHKGSFFNGLIRKDSALEFFLFGPSSLVGGANSCIWAWQIAAREPLMMRTNEPQLEDRED